MDPTIVKGSIFTSRNATSQICDMWKQSVKREQHIAKDFARSQASLQKKDDGEGSNCAITPEGKSPSPSSTPDKLSPPKVSPTLLQTYYDTQIKTLQETSKKGPLLTASSQEIGGRLKHYTAGQPLDNAQSTEHGHKPVITSSFYRTCSNAGVMQ